jgi:hypothetical protein
MKWILETIREDGFDRGRFTTIEKLDAANGIEAAHAAAAKLSSAANNVIEIRIREVDLLDDDDTAKLVVEAAQAFVENG